MADVTLPQLGETVTEGTITQWFKSVGDTVTADEPLFEVSTDKVDTEVPSPVSGVLTEIRVQEGDTVDVGTVIAVVGDADGAAPAAPAPAAEPAPVPEPAPEPEPRRQHRHQRRRPRPRHAATPVAPPPPPAVQPAPATAETAQAGDNRLLSPVVRRLVNEHGLDPDAITGSGPGGRITRDDVLDHIDATGANRQDPAAVAAPAAAPAAATPAAAPAAATPAAHQLPHGPPHRRPRPPPASVTRSSRCRRSVA